MIIHFRNKHKVTPEPVFIEDSAVERVNKCKYLGVAIGGKLKRNEHIAYVDRRLKPGLYCFYKHNSLILAMIFLPPFTIMFSVVLGHIVFHVGQITQRKCYIKSLIT